MNNDLVVFNKPKSSISEAIRTLRTNIQFTMSTNSAKVFMITSSIPGEGKSFISANLACAFSMINYKTLLIDCDLRKGRQDKLFNLDTNKGLSNLLIDDTKKYKNFICKTENKYLDILPIGINPPNPSELLGSDKCKELFNRFKSDYDIVILDCPPINQLADALVITDLADQAVLVAAYKKTPYDLLSNSKKVLDKCNIKIAGVILNKVEWKNSNYYYYEKYYK